MTRQELTDGSGKWFDLAQARKYKEDTYWNGNNTISCATGSQWEHEELYYTKGKRWIKHWMSQWQGSLPQWTEITPTRAAEWLVNNHHGAHPSVEAEYAALEIA